jgi:molecular chaperone GrpE
LHEAVAVQESSTARPDSVLQVLQSGYQLNGRLLRPARVIVARQPQAPA